MNETSWQVCQIMMWVFGIQTTLILGALGFLWSHMNKRFDKVDERFEKIDARFEKGEGKIQALTDRVLVIETILANKEVCHFHDPKQLKEAQ